MTFCLRVFGTVALEGPCGAVTGRAVQQRPLALLALLASAHPHGWTRDKLVAFLWPDSDQERARHRLADVTHVIRKSLGEDAIISIGELVQLNRTRVESDVALFLTACEAGDFEAAVGAYTGPFLDGFALSGAPEFERWVEGQRQRLGDTYAEALHALTATAKAGGDQVAVAKWWKRLLAHDPYNSRYVLGLIEALALSGDPANAWLFLDEHERRLREDLEVDPPGDLRRRAGELLAGQPPADSVASAGAKPPAEASGDQVLAGVPSRSASTADRDSPGERAARLRRRRRALSVGAVLVGVSGLVAWYVATAARGRERAVGGGAAAHTRVAVFPFSVPPDPEFADLREGLMELLGAAIDEAGDVRAVDPNTLLNRMRSAGAGNAVDVEDARRIAGALGASHFVLGRVVDLRGPIRISTSLYELSTDSLWQSVRTGAIEDLLTLVDGLALDMLLRAEPLRGEFRASVRPASTTRYRALRAYLRGQAFMRGHRIDSAQAAFTTAVREDSLFAQAWLRLAEAEDWEGRPVASLRALQRADGLRARLTGRDRAFLAAGYGWARGDGPAAERAARAFVTAYPSAAEGWRYLGEVLRWYPWQLGRNTALEADHALQQALALDPDNRLALNGLALVAYHEGEKTRGDSLWRAWAGEYSVPPEDSIERARYFAGLENAGLGLLRFRAWFIPFATDSLGDAARVAARLTDSRRPAAERAIGHHLAAFIRVAGGRWRAAEAHFAEADRLVPGTGVLERAWYSTFPPFDADTARLRATRDSLASWIPPQALGTRQGMYWVNWEIPRWLLPHAKHYVLGLLSARLADDHMAAQYAARLEQAEEPVDSIGLLADLALEVRALVATESGNWQGALTLLENAALAVRQSCCEDSPLVFRPLGRVLRAEALMRLGRDEEALGWYSSLNWRGLAESVLLAHAELRRGEIYERLGHPTEAVRHYRRFAARWQAADPEYQPLVADVNARIVRLGGARH